MPYTVIESLNCSVFDSVKEMKICLVEEYLIKFFYT